MAPDARNGRSRLEIRSDWLLLVEGKDEENLFDALIGDRIGAEAEIQVIDAGGVRKFPRSLSAIRTAAQARPTLRSIGVVRDADDDAAAAFTSVCSHLRNAGYAPPPAHGEFSGAVPSIGVFIAPDGSEPGAMETLCRRSIEGTDAAKCVDAYLECLERHGAIHSNNLDKSFAHAWLAAARNPVARVGEGARAGVWSFGSPAFAGLSRFLRDLKLQGA